MTTNLNYDLLPVVHEDETLIAINKPAGLLVHRSRIASDAQQFAVQQLRDQIGQRVYPVHRLDRPTSGILLFALNAEVARDMSALFASREVSKMYHAVVRGFVEEHGQIDYALKEELDAIADKRARSDKEAQHAVTDFMTLARVELPYKVSKQHETSRYSLLQLSPKTGRKHQLRRHLAHIRHPIVGDTTHGDGRHNAFFRSHFNSQRLLLAATGLEFKHPQSGKVVNIRVDVPEEFWHPFRAPEANV
jgi:tRNA pseudouridine65 synthase